MTINLNDFKRETECVYKDEHYSVRDNGAILRHAREGRHQRKDDNRWTFGKSDSKKYLKIGTEFIHRIIATAFHGDPPTPQYIVDHIDTNRQNNRLENLRWFTKLENTLNNPITVKKIIFHCGSVEAFLEDPSILRNHIKEDRNFEWMRAVTPEEAQTSWKRLSNWAKKENNNSSSKGRSLGEWIFIDDRNSSSVEELSKMTNAETPNAVQRNWKTPSEFPCCPQESSNDPINSYAANLKIGEIFSRNKYLSSIILDFATSEDANTLLIMCKAIDDNAIKPWTLAQITYEDNLFVHTNLGSFFEKIGAEKQFTLMQGHEWTGEDSFDDLP